MANAKKKHDKSKDEGGDGLCGGISDSDDDTNCYLESF